MASITDKPPQLSQPPSPPYQLREALLGGTPTPLPDLPPIIILLVFLTVFLLLHLFTLYLDRTRLPHVHRTAHRVIPLLLIAFPVTRIAALATRLAWAFNHANRHLEIASSILTPAATVFLLVANLMLARRFMRDYAVFGFHKAVLRIARAGIFCALAALVMGVSVRADSYFTLDEDTLRDCRRIGLAASAILTAVAVVPGVMVLVGGWLFPVEGGEVEMERGRKRARGQMIVFVGALLTLVEGFRCGVAAEGREVGDEAWFLHKACYYCLGYVPEVVVLYTLLFARLDQRFRLRPTVDEKENGGGVKRGWYERLVERVNTEMEIFGDVGVGHRDEEDGEDDQAREGLTWPTAS